MSDHPERPEGPAGAAPDAAEPAPAGPSAAGPRAAEPSAGAAPGPSAADDILQGLGFLARAARKVVAELDPARVEELARKAAETPVAREVGRRASDLPDRLEALVGSAVETFNKEGPAGLAQRASRALDPERVEKVAGTAGREILDVVERLAHRVEEAARSTRSEFLKNAAGPAGAEPAAAPSTAPPAAAPSAPPAAQAAPPATPAEAAPAPPEGRFRVEE